jgi:hypothetical protein
MATITKDIFFDPSVIDVPYTQIVTPPITNRELDFTYMKQARV